MIGAAKELQDLTDVLGTGLVAVVSMGRLAVHPLQSHVLKGRPSVWVNDSRNVFSPAIPTGPVDLQDRLMPVMAVTFMGQATCLLSRDN